VIDVTKHHGLASLPGFPFEVHTSASTREQAERLAGRCARAYSFLGDMLAFRPRCALLVLSRADWSERASNPAYVMPYYDAGHLFLPGEPSDLTARLEEVTGSAPPAAAQELNQVYGTGADRLAPFADMFEAFYPSIEPLTYVWYQFRFTMMAKGVVDAAGPNALRRLWDAFALTDEQFAGLLGRQVGPAAGQWLDLW
jgi:hypothetical protein